MRYFVDLPARLVAIQDALNEAHDLPRPQMFYPGRGNAPVSADLAGVPAFDLPNANWPVYVGDDGTAAVALPEDISSVQTRLGTTIDSVALPRANQLVEEVDLPTRVRAALEASRAPPSETAPTRPR